MHDPVVRRLAPQEVELAVEWAAKEDWNPGVHDAATFARVDPDGFFVAKQAGEPLGFVSCARWGRDFAFVGLYMVRPDRRHEGIGHLLAAKALERLGDRVGGLDGVVSQQENYQESGFVLSHRTFRYRGPAHAWAPTTATGDVVLLPLVGPTLGSALFDQLVALDARHAPAPRPRYLRAWLSQPQLRCAMATVRGEPVGLVAARPAHLGWRVGPLLAPDSHVAEVLMGAAVTGLGDTPISLDVPEPNGDGAAMALDHDMTSVFETARMYRGQPRAYDLGAVYGLTSLEPG